MAEICIYIFQISDRYLTITVIEQFIVENGTLMDVIYVKVSKIYILGNATLVQMGENIMIQPQLMPFCLSS